uniref:SPOR domain-containing protein n=1 Tax=candidate division WOR-3 bacterium TaxID=2052148 RepID=A0A7C4TB91_UNCW3
MSRPIKLVILGCGVLLIFCAPKKTTVKAEGLEEVVVLGEEEKNVSEEPVYPGTPPATQTTPAPTEITPAPAEIPPAPPVEEAAVLPPVIEETPTPPPKEEAVVPPPPVVEEAPPAPPKEEVAVVPPPAPPVAKPTAPMVPSVAPQTVYGFRVQIFASTTQRNASRVADDARSVFGGKVYIEYVPPYYKVRIGDCLTKEEAETLKNRALSAGYRGAFVVETMITP